MMIDTPCVRSQCPEMPKVSLDQAVVDLMESIALQETALSHILCAELVLKDKLEFVSNNLYVPGDSSCPSPAQ